MPIAIIMFIIIVNNVFVLIINSNNINVITIKTNESFIIVYVLRLLNTPELKSLLTTALAAKIIID